MAFTRKHDSLETALARLTLSPLSPSCRTLLPELQPTVDEILRTLSPTDAEVFRSVLDGVTLISHTPPFAKQHPPLPEGANADPFLAAFLANMAQSRSSLSAELARNAREIPVLFFANYSPPSGMMFDPRVDHLRYAARAALRFTTAELNDEMRLALLGCVRKSWAKFTPLVRYRLACAAALGPLIDLGPPPAVLTDEYAWTWRTCTLCARHSGRGACGAFCADAPWFAALWNELVAILRARPDPDAVVVHGREHFSRALQQAMECTACVKVAQEHLRCFEGLLVVEAAKRIAEVPFEL